MIFSSGGMRSKVIPLNPRKNLRLLELGFHGRGFRLAEITVQLLLMGPLAYQSSNNHTTLCVFFHRQEKRIYFYWLLCIY